jgi:hypothetical protein
MHENRKGWTMNKYGLQAKEFWKANLPTRYAGLGTKAERRVFFEEMGEQIEAKVTDLAQALERQLAPTGDYLKRVADLQAVQAQAEEVVMHDCVYFERPEMGRGSRREALDEMLGQLPGEMLIDERLAEIQNEAEEYAIAEYQRETDDGTYPEIDQLTITYDENQKEQIDLLTRLKTLVVLPGGLVENLSEEEAERRIEGIKALLRTYAHHMAPYLEVLLVEV